MDGFHLAQVELERLGRAQRKGAPDTFDAAGYAALLRRLRTQTGDEVVYAPDFRREMEEPVAGALPVFAHTPLVITEGNYLLLQDAGWAPATGSSMSRRKSGTYTTSSPVCLRRRRSSAA
jgi:pantothenate kinase